MNFTLAWNKREQALVLSFVYPFETEPGVQKESVEIYTKFQGYRALQGIIHRSEENGHKLLPEELFLFWKELREKLFSQVIPLPIFCDDDLTSIHESLPGARYDTYEVKKMRVRTFLKETVEKQFRDLVTQNNKKVRTSPMNRTSSGHAPDNLRLPQQS